MSMRLQRLSHRPAPPGVRAPARDPELPPDGWEVLDASWPERVAIRVDSSLLRLADTAARATSRRAFLAGASGAGVALVGLGSTGVLWGTRSAQAGHVLEPCNRWDGSGSPCGPSPYCPGSHCINSGDMAGWCRNALGEVTWRQYLGNTCDPNTVHSCWREQCCANFSGHFMCCDCCSNSGAGSRCQSCPDNPNRFICTCSAKIRDC